MSWWLELSREQFAGEIAVRYAVNRAEESQRSFRVSAHQMDSARRGGQQRAKLMGSTVKASPEPSAHNGQKTTCKHGHPFDEANTRIRKKDGARICRTCLADGRQRYKAKFLQPMPPLVAMGGR
jgi:hypothetical protein